MSQHNHVPAEAEARHREYVELVQLIVQTTWRPGDFVRTAAGTIWQFRPVSYTSDLPEAEEQLAPDVADCHAPANQRAQAVRRDECFTADATAVPVCRGVSVPQRASAHTRHRERRYLRPGTGVLPHPARPE